MVQPKKIRLFIALKPDSVSTTRILSLIRKLKRDYPGKFYRRDKLHLTLVFLGWVKQDNLNIIQEILRKDTARFTPLRFQTALLELHQKSKERNHLWLKFELSPSLKSFQTKLAQDLSKKGFQLEKRAFLAHLTLAQQIKTKQKISQVIKLRLNFRQLILYQSILSPKGSRYRAILTLPQNAPISKTN